MIYLFLVFIAISMYKISFKNIDSIDTDALDKERTTMVNGFFVGLVLFSHFNSYAKSNLPIDSIYYFVFKIGQLMVTTFLFYSGYGIYESIKNKKNYIDTFFRKRIVKLFISVCLSIILYLILDLAIGKNYSVADVLLSLTGFKSIGNSNWFIFATFCMYFSVLISFKIFKKDHLSAILMCLIFTFCYILSIMKFVGYAWWCNTILCFNAGMIFSYYKEKILDFLKNNYHYIFTLIILGFIFILSTLNNSGYFTYNIISLSFVLAIVILSLKIKVGNKFLFWLGKNTFNIYILQRLTYIFYDYVGLKTYNIYLYFIVSVVTLLILMIPFERILNKIIEKMKI